MQYSSTAFTSTLHHLTGKSMQAQWNENLHFSLLPVLLCGHLGRVTYASSQIPTHFLPICRVCRGFSSAVLMRVAPLTLAVQPWIVKHTLIEGVFLSMWQKAPARLSQKCEHVNLKASQPLGAGEKENKKIRQRVTERERERELGGLLFLSSVFFHSSITQCGEGSFPPTHRRCQGGHTQTVRVNVHSTLYTLIHAHTHIDDRKGHSTYLRPLSITYHSLLSWLCLFSLVLLSP